MPRYGSGDGGMTDLPGGARVAKSHPRVEACGDLDELCSVLGALAASFSGAQESMRGEIHRVQGALLSVGAAIAMGQSRQAREQALPPVAELDAAIERMEAELPALGGFILPGGHPTAAWAHVARTVCRRAERRASVLTADGLSAGILGYLNRLSTYLYDLARLCNRENAVAETEWRG